MIVKAVGTTNTTIYSSTEMSLIKSSTPFKSVQMSMTAITPQNFERRI